MERSSNETAVVEELAANDMVHKKSEADSLAVTWSGVEGV